MLNRLNHRSLFKKTTTLKKPTKPTKKLKKYYAAHSLYNKKLMPGHDLFKYIQHTGKNLYSLLTDETLTNGLLALFRCINNPTALPYFYKKKYSSTAHLEIKKAQRTIEKNKKEGNPNRSVILPAGIQQDAFTSCGLATFVDVKNTDYFEDILSRIKVISRVDIDSGENWKKILPTEPEKTLSEEMKKLISEEMKVLKNRDEKIERLIKLIIQQKKGGLERPFNEKNGITVIGKHPEIILTLMDKDIHGLFFTLEKNFRSEAQAPFPDYRHHPYAPFLLDVFIQQTYFNLSSGKLLPIYHYSAESKIIQEVTYTHEAILAIWKEVITDFFNQCKNANVQAICQKSISKLSLDELKVYALKGRNEKDIDPFGEVPADMYYPLPIKKQIDAFLEEMWNTYCKNNIEQEQVRKPGV